MIFARCPACGRVKALVRRGTDKLWIRTHHERGPMIALHEVSNQPRCAGSQQLVTSGVLELP